MVCHCLFVLWQVLDSVHLTEVVWEVQKMSHSDTVLVCVTVWVFDYLLFIYWCFSFLLMFPSAFSCAMSILICFLSVVLSATLTCSLSLICPAAFHVLISPGPTHFSFLPPILNSAFFPSPLCVLLSSPVCWSLFSLVNYFLFEPLFLSAHGSCCW